MAQAASYLLPFSLQLIKKNQVMQMVPLLFAVFLLLIIPVCLNSRLALGALQLMGLVQMVPLLLLLLTLCLCLLRQNRASLDPSSLLIVVQGQVCVEIRVLQMPVSWLRHFLVLVLGTDRLSLAVQLLARILRCWVYLVLQLMIWLVFWAVLVDLALGLGFGHHLGER